MSERGKPLRRRKDPAASPGEVKTNPAPASLRSDPAGDSSQQHDLLHHAIRCLADGVVVVDGSGRILLANEAAERIVGLGPRDVHPAKWSSVYGCYLPDKVTPYPARELPLARALRGEHVSDVEIFIRNENNPRGTWISVNSSPVVNGAGKHCGGVIVFRDITTRRDSDETIRRLSKAIERTTDAVFITDQNGKIEYVNPAFEAITGYRCEEALGRLPRILKSGVHEPEYYEKLWRTILDGHVHSATLVNRRKNGELFYAEQTITPIKDEVGNLTHFVSVLRDVTEIKRAERREVEMRLARIVQQKLYPLAPTELSGFDIAGAAFPADDTCGDYFDFITMPDDCMGVAVGDVSGHGFGSALLMAETRAYLRSLAQTTSDVRTIFDRLNAFLCADTEDERFVTLFLARLDTRRRSLVYASAGHIPAYLFDGSGAVKKILHSTGLPLGIFCDAAFTTSPKTELVPGDVLLVLTDGVTESQDAEERFFGDQRTITVVAARRERGAREIISDLYTAIQSFASGAPQLDDITAVVCRVLNAGESASQSAHGPGTLS